MRVRVFSPLVAVSALFITTAPVQAATLVPSVTPPGKMISVADSSYLPATIKTSIKYGPQGVVWDFNNATPRSATDATGLGLFASGVRSTASVMKTYFFGFFASGSYAYHSSNLATMRGTVLVPIVRSATGGTTATTFRLRWARGSHASFRYDIEVLGPAAAHWKWWHYGEKVNTGTFTSSRTGTWSFRARLRRVSTAKVSGFSPVATIKVT